MVNAGSPEPLQTRHLIDAAGASRERPLHAAYSK